MYNGVINVYKEKGYTSFDVVARLRGILKQKKIGHTGTLDPDAEGVLVVCLGKATKLCDILTDKDKRYDAVLRLGMTTDTEDSSGKVLSQSEVTVSEQEVSRAVLSFVGEYDQIPPMYSAIKVDGKKLYELARAGIEIERKPRRVIIHDIEIKEINLPYVTFSVSCGKGTYIRSLCRDIGDKLGCGGIMDSLVRSSVNIEDSGLRFELDNAIKLDDIETMVKNNTINDHIIPVAAVFPKGIRVCADESGDKKLKNGNVLSYKELFCYDDGKKITKPEGEDNNDYIVYDSDKTFTAIYRYDQSVHCLKAWKMFL
ncbi:MAG: tRNA pseudouridine(55) synthase TruB [Lachnospiraceae bacterium]|nr:tRNA pseudouridine(55) synthase TruB [Lachnospiraceae bacterium]